MATAYNMLAMYPDINQPPKWSPGVQYIAEFELTLGASVVTGDTYTTPVGALPKNSFRIVETTLISVNLDTNATPTATVSVGDGTSATRFINAAIAGNGSALTGATLRASINQAQAVSASTGLVTAGYGFLYDTGVSPQLIVTIGGTVATAASSGIVRLQVTYTCTEEN